MPQPIRPLIGLNLDLVPASKTAGSHLRLDTGYAEAVLAAGGMPVLMPLLGREPEIAAFLERVDGFVLTSGPDLDPRRQGLFPHSAVRPMAPKREDQDRLLAKILMERQTPVLAVGAGMHLVNLLAGGTLFQHLPEEQPRALPHADPGNSGPHRHGILLQPGAQLEEIYGGGEILVNSNHHQAVKTVGGRFRVSAVAPDGVIEAIESTDPQWYCVGVQWDPHSATASALDMQLFESFIQAAIRAGIKGPTLAKAG